MANYEKQFEQIVGNLDIDVQPNAEHKKALRKQFLAACKDASYDKTAPRIQPIWSRIMKSNITKSAAAAIIVIGAFIFLTQGNGTPVFAQVAAAMEKMPWMHVATNGSWKEGEFKEESWYSFESQTEIHTIPNGDIVMYDFTNHQEQNYNSDKNVITLTSLEGEFALDAPDATSPADFLTKWQKYMSDYTAELNEHQSLDVEAQIVSSYGKHNGKRAEVYELTLPRANGKVDCKIVADAETHLPIFSESVYTDSKGSVECKRESYLDFPVTGPDTLYVMGVSTATKVIDCTESALEQLFAAGDLKSITTLFNNGTNEAKLAVVNYLSKIGDEQALETLKMLDISNLAKPIQKTVKQRIERIEEQLGTVEQQQESVGVAVPADSDSPTPQEENEPNQTVNPDVSAPTDKSTTALANSEEKSGRLVKIHVTDKKTGNPIEKATVYVVAREEIWTDKNGYCELRWDKNDKEYGKIMSVWVRKNGYVRMSYSVRTENSPGEDPIDIHYAMEKGTIVGGIVQNTDGKNMAGIDLTVRVNDDEHMDKPENHVRQGAITDENGRWEIDCVPEQLEIVNLRTKHADYSDQDVWLKTSEDIQLLRDKEYVLVVDEGYSITGTVKDEAGKPIKGARVQLGDYYFNRDRQHRTQTNENGHFDFKHLRISRRDLTYDEIEGKGKVPVQYPTEYLTVTADGFAPQMMQLFFKENGMAVEFTMTPGNPVYGRVMDYEGNPVPQATVRADDWKSRIPNDMRSIDWNTKTNANGRFVWQHAPADEVELVVSKSGFLTLEGQKVTPSDIEYEFVLNPQVRVSGQAIDAVTKKPITEFTFRRHEGGSIKAPKLVKNSEGRFETSFADQSETFTISFEADGYKPTRSRSISLTEQDVELVIEMWPDAGIDGVIVGTDGKPVEDVEVIIPKWALDVYFRNGEKEILQLRHQHHTITDSEGRFHFDPVAGDQYSLVVFDEQGYIYMQAKDFPENGIFTLQPYGRIEGTYYKGSKPVTNETIKIDYPNYHFSGARNLIMSYWVQTDEEGHFVFDNLIEGEARILIDPYKHVDIKAGKTHEVHIGGNGLTVQGYVLNPEGQPLNEDLGDCFLSFQKIYDSLPIPEEEWPLPDNADAMTYSELMGWFNQLGDSDEGRKWIAAMQQKYGDLTGHHSFDIDYKGRFEVPNVTPGMYLFSVVVRAWQNPDQHPRMTDYNRTLAQASMVFIVPEYETVEEMDIPVDLGTIQCRPAPLVAGQKAPGFDIPNLKSAGRIRLADYSGKTVLLNFTNPILKEGEPEKAAVLEQVCEQATGKATIINVAMEMIPWDLMRQKMIPECTLPGLYGVAVAHNSKIYTDYKTAVDGQTIAMPYSVLINPAGTILWIGEPNEELLILLSEL